MQELIEKRKKYFEEIDKLNKEIDSKAQEYFDSKVEQLKEETTLYREKIALDYQKRFSDITSKIDIIDEIISEQMPEAKEIQNLMNQEKVEPEVIKTEETFELINETETVVEEVDLDCPEQQAEYEITISADEIPTSNVIEKELEETPCEVHNEIIEENLVCDICQTNNSINENSYVKTDDSRPGMPQILNPR